MDMGGGDSAVANLPLSNPACNTSDCIAFEAASNQSQLVTPWAGQFEYGHWTTWYYLVIIFIVMLWRAFRIWNDRTRHEDNPRTTAPTYRQRGLAAGRYLSYRRFRGAWSDMLELPSLGVLVLLLTTVLYLSLLTFVARPYYRVHEGYGSPPIAIRSGLMAFACTPILIALAGKANMVTLLTGVSHEKLNVIHRWTGWITLVLSLIHTIPFIVAPLRDRGYTTLHQEFYGYGLIGATMVSQICLMYLNMSTSKLRSFCSETVQWSSAACHAFRSCSTIYSLHSSSDLRRLLLRPCRPCHHLPRSPFLACWQRIRLLGLSLGNTRPLACIIPCTRILVHSTTEPTERVALRRTHNASQAARGHDAN